MLNTQLILALAGAACLLSTPAAAQGGTCTLGSPCVGGTPTLEPLALPSSYGQSVVKLHAGPMVTSGVQDGLALTNSGSLVVIRSPLLAAGVHRVATDVVDFAATTPGAGQRAFVVAIGPEGLRLGELTAGGEDTLGATLDFSNVLDVGTWSSASNVDVIEQEGVLFIVGSAESKLCRATYNIESTEYLAYDDWLCPSQIEFLAVAELSPAKAGPEVVWGTGAQLSLLGDFEAQNLPSPFKSVPALFGTILSVKRIPFGADVRDSLGVVERAASTDVFREITDVVDSAPIATAHLRVADMAYGSVGLSAGCTSNCVPTDALVAAVGGENLIFQGMAQATGGFQFEFLPSQPSAFHMSSLLCNAAVTQTRVALGDLDGDGDGDVLYAALVNGAAQFVALENTCSVNDPNLAANVSVDTIGASFAPDSSGTAVDVGVTANVRMPPNWSVPPTHLRVRVYTRKYTLEPAGSPTPLQQDPVSPILWYDRDLLLTNTLCAGPWGVGYSCSVPVNIPWTDLPLNYLPPGDQLTTGNTLLYFELTPVQYGELGAVLSAPQTFWVGSVSVGLLNQLICVREPDEFSSSFGSCAPVNPGGPSPGAPLINEIHRRKRIRPIGTPPQ
ncbi:MAG: hypothetical protein JNN27_20855 [Planctomycetes bacterium]|nr:hypothetical protein [Planctomycetota bacterium]